MTRVEVIKGLEAMIGVAWLSKITEQEQAILRAAIALLTVPTVAEIEAARKRVVNIYNGEGPENFFAPIRATIYRALDALAREPGLEAEWAERVRAVQEAARFKIAAISAKLARVQALADEYKDAVLDSEAEVLRDLLVAALADEATP